VVWPGRTALGSTRRMSISVRSKISRASPSDLTWAFESGRRLNRRLRGKTSLVMMGSGVRVPASAWFCERNRLEIRHEAFLLVTAPSGHEVTPLDGRGGDLASVWLPARLSERGITVPTVVAVASGGATQTSFARLQGDDRDPPDRCIKVAAARAHTFKPAPFAHERRNKGLEHPNQLRLKHPTRLLSHKQGTGRRTRARDA
jgi:hypothetical protein